MKNLTMPRVTVTIDRLVLRGFAPEQRDSIAAGLVAELQIQFGASATGGQFGDSRSLASLQAKPAALPAAAKPQQIGAHAARALARGIRS
jgi:hypothetical protein